MKFFNFNSIIIRIIAALLYFTYFKIRLLAGCSRLAACSVTNYYKMVVKPKKMKPKKSKMLN